MDIITVTSAGHGDRVVYTHDEWNIRNGSYAHDIMLASETDSWVRFFVKLLDGAPYVVLGNPRLAVAYGYFVYKGYIPLEVAVAICATEIMPVTEEEVALLMQPVT